MLVVPGVLDEISRVRWGALLLALAATACGSNNLASKIVKAPALGGDKCSVKGGKTKPLIVEWESAARGDLEVRARRGPVAVRYTGCEMELLPDCIVPGKYGYTPFTAKQDRISMTSEDDLYANVPVGAAKLEAELRMAGQLVVEMTLVGKFEADSRQVKRTELKGECAQATHVIAGLTVGAFDFYSGTDASVGGGVQVVGVGVGAKTAASRKQLNKDGKSTECERASPKDTDPPAGCGALLRLELVPLQGEAQSSCPDDSSWDGKQCVHKHVVTKVDCPLGTSWNGSKCAGTVDTTCSGGTHFEAGRGCVPNVVASPAPVAAVPALSQNEARTLVTNYYDSRGEWAGTFRLSSILRMRFVPVGGDAGTKVDVHVLYSFAPVPGNKGGRTDSGEDQRVFRCQRVGDSWVVTNMGDHMSATF